jgi:hypothetical protein
MPNRVRGVRQDLPANVLIGRLAGKGGPAQQISLDAISNAILQRGGLPLPGTISSAALDAVFGSAQGDILYRNATVWTVLSPGTSGQFLETQGPAANVAWASVPNPTFNNRGAWSGSNAYSPFDVVTFDGSAYLNYAAVSAPSNIITLDGSASNYANSSAPTVTLTTSNANDIIVVVVQAVSFTGSPSVTSITDGAGLTWHLRKQFQFTPGFPGANGYSDTEVWWAKSTGTLSGDTITVNLNATNNTALTAFGLHGAASLVAPFDTNAALPATGSNQSNTSPTVTVSTSIGSGDGIVIFTEMSSAHGGGWSLGTVPGYTQIAIPHGGSVDGGVFYKHITSDLSGSVITSNDSDAFWSTVGDCVDGGSTPNTTPALDDGHWIAQGAAASSAAFDLIFGNTPGSVLYRDPVNGWFAAFAGSAVPEHHAFMGGV